MKSIVKYINESNFIKRFDRDTIADNCPNFFRIISQFCRDMNSEELEFLIDTYTLSNPEDFNKLYKKHPFSNKELQKFEQDYLTDEALTEIENFVKNN